MKLKLVRHLWGVDLTRALDSYLPRWQEVGYEALEVPLRGLTDQPAFFKFLKSTGLGWVPQVFSNDPEPGGSVEQHIESLRKQLEACMEHGPLFFNAHSGSDAWSQSQAEDFYGRVLELEKEIGVPISHETHRQRTFGNPWQTRPILELYPELRLTCDFSHWVCVAERLLPDCGEIIQLAASHCHHLHARVGFEEGPQVSDPRAPEWASHVGAHEKWWDQIWASQRQRGMEVSTLTPEFGPFPYQAQLPFTQAPVADLADICDSMATRQKSRFPAVSSPF